MVALENLEGMGKEVQILGIPFILVEKNFGKTLIFVRPHANKIVFASILVRGFQIKPFYTQDLIWSDKENVERGFARKFMEYVVNEYGAIQTSSKQRSMGMEMWKKFVESSLGKFHVYVGGREEEPVPINSVKELHDLANILWGSTAMFADQFVRVSKDPL